MPMLMALKGALMFLGVIALLILVVIGAEIAVIVFLHIGEGVKEGFQKEVQERKRENLKKE